MEEILGKQPPQLFGIPLKKKSGLLIVWKILEPVYLFSLLMFSVACQQFFICMYFYYHTYATICPKYSLKVLRLGVTDAVAKFAQRSDNAHRRQRQQHSQTTVVAGDLGR